jgi:hypothetical protein
VTAEAAPVRNRLALAALGFAAAAALSSWNPLSAPFGLLVGLASIVLAVRALMRGGRRLAAASALVLSVAAPAASGLVLALTAGVGRELGGTPVVPAPDRAEVERTLDDAAERTRPARERARSELEELEGKGGEKAGERGDAPAGGAARGSGGAR